MLNYRIIEGTLFESIEYHDLDDLVSNTIHIDEFKAKIGGDDENIVISFKVLTKEPAEDLENFLEKGYEWILDADVSTGELENDYYLVFVEFERRHHLLDDLMDLIEDLTNLTNNDKWFFSYFEPLRQNQKYELNRENLEKIVPLSPKHYRELRESAYRLENLKLASGMKSKYKVKQRSVYTDNLRLAAGIPINEYRKTTRRID